MASTNLVAARTMAETHNGAPAFVGNATEQLRRSVMSCLLWESEFYEDGQEIGDRIATLAKSAPFDDVAHTAIEARQRMHLRHVPLYLAALLAQRHSEHMRGHQGYVSRMSVEGIIATVIERADELGEFLALYAKINGVPPDKLKGKISHPVMRGVAAAFGKFDAYQLAKYDRAKAVRLRDAAFLCHVKPRNAAEATLLAKLVNKTFYPEEIKAKYELGDYEALPTPDTWETNLSKGSGAKETFERLITEKRLGYLAALRNLRNMHKAGVDYNLVFDRIVSRRGAERVLPFRYVAAARAVPEWESMVDRALLGCIEEMPKLPGKTVILVDVSGSMVRPLSAKSDLKRIDAAAALGAIAPCDQLRVFSFSNTLVEVPNRRGMAGVDAIQKSQPHQGTALGQSIAYINTNVAYDRLIVITDEQSNDAVPAPNPYASAYMINVASAQNGVGYGPWMRIHGFSEHIFTYIREMEAGGRK